MKPSELKHKAEAYLDQLCRQIPTRQVGSQGNRQATDFFRSVISRFGYQTTVQPFDCIDMRTGNIELTVAGNRFTAFISPYSLGCQVRAELVGASSMQELEQVQAAGKLLLLRGELTREMLMPKNFVFFNPENHQEIYKLVEQKQPAAIIAATGRNPQLAGARYPFPLFEDGDFDIPSGYMTDEEGERLSALIGKEASLSMDAERIPAQAENVIAHKPGQSEKKTVLCAHIDAVAGTPGALDNATGVVVLLLAAELLAAENPRTTIEIVAFNGEDYYSAGGQMAYLAAHADLKSAVELAINLDGVGYKGFSSGLSFYEAQPYVVSAAQSVIERFTSIEEMAQWYQGDHMIFVMNQVPALAFTTTGFSKLQAEVAHSEKDVPQLVDARLLADLALGLSDLVRLL